MSRSDFAAAPGTPGLKLKWKDGWIEDFPEEEFAEECEGRPRRILMYHRRLGTCDVEYTLTVSGAEAWLDYGRKFEKANLAPERDIFIGVTRITFADEERTFVKEVAWWAKGRTTFEQHGVEASWAEHRGRWTKFKPPGRKSDRRRRELRTSVLRPGQLRFRRLLLEEYGKACAALGQASEEVLEAAHIMPYRGPAFDHPANGLLLRADLHRLYDRLLFSIEPKSLKIKLTTTLAKDQHYSFLEGRALSFKKGGLRPDPRALKDHWDRFNKALREHRRT